MNIVVFTGPSLSAKEAAQTLPATYAPPAAFGDVYRRALGQPSAIALIDGFFENQPATWHKEILWAMRNGVHVFGAASMGALRAAELAPLGMVGVGKIFRSFESGELEDDDEVAVAHGPESSAFAVLSVAMVDIRFTLRAAVAQRIIEPAFSELLCVHGKRLNFRERSYARVLQEARAAGASETDLERFRGWLPGGQVRQKRADALELLQMLRAWSELQPGPKLVTYAFSRTDAWETATSRLTEADGQQQRDAEDAALFEELQISGEYPRIMAHALNRALASTLCSRMGREPDTEAMGRGLDDLRFELSLADDEAFARWMSEQELPESELENFAKDEIRLRWSQTFFATSARRKLADALRALGEHGYYADRARQKQQLLREDAATARAPELDPHAVVAWYFSEYLGLEQPSDLAAHARSNGFEDIAGLLRAIQNEYDAQRRGLPPP